MDGTVGPAAARPGEPGAGRVAVVTGASRGLGAGMAARFAARGLHLGLCARSEPPAPAAPPGVTVLTRSLDVTDAAALDAFCDAVVDRCGPIDLWIDNAGVLAPIGPLRDLDPDELAAHVATNVAGVLHGSATFARHVRGRSGGGTLVNISSGAGKNPYAGWSAYCASKAAVDHLTRVVAAEEADAGLRAYAVAPGVVDTAMQALIRETPPERFPAVERFHRLARDDAFNSPAWVADRILDLAFGPGEGDAAGWGGADVVRRVPDEPRG